MEGRDGARQRGQQGTSGVEKQVLAVVVVVIIREERKKVKEDGRQKVDITRDLGHGL